MKSTTLSGDRAGGLLSLQITTTRLIAAVTFAHSVGTPFVSTSRSFLAGLTSAWAFLLGFLASLAWFIWTETQQTGSSCGNGPDYVQSAAIMFLVIIAVFAIRRRPRRGQTAWPFLGEVVATAAWTAIGLSVAIFFAAATGCSA
jgi:hypothetical protein